MSFIVDWNGSVVSPAVPSALWSTKGGVFTSKIGINTYFPLPMSYAASIPIVGTFTVTAAEKNRADLIAKQLYDSEEYWWLVYWMNGIIDPFAALNVGDKINIADLTVLQTMVK